MKSKKLVIYEDRKTGSLFIRSTKIAKGGKKFSMKHHHFGKAISGKLSDAKLGRAVREILQSCE
jgi:hypothetical protein